MTPADYLAALAAAGIDTTQPARMIDMQAGALLAIDDRTARRYRTGEGTVPGPVRIALSLLKVEVPDARLQRDRSAKRGAHQARR
jgi:hypothetical protein